MLTRLGHDEACSCIACTTARMDERERRETDRRQEWIKVETERREADRRCSEGGVRAPGKSPAPVETAPPSETFPPLPAWLRALGHDDLADKLEIILARGATP